MSLQSRRLRTTLAFGALSLALWFAMDPSIWWKAAPAWGGLLFFKLALFALIPLLLVLWWLGFGPRMVNAWAMGFRRLVALWTPDPGATWLAFASGTRDLAQARRCLEHAAEEGHPEGRLELALAFQDGSFGHGGELAALPLLQSLAKEGDAEAMAHLALAYFWGRGVQRDPASAERWMRQAAEADHGAAAAWLAKAYANGDGVPLSEVESQRWQARATDAPLPRPSLLSQHRDPERQDRLADLAAKGEAHLDSAFGAIFSDPILRRVFLSVSVAFLGALCLGFLTLLLVGWSAFWVFAIPLPICLLLALWWSGGHTGPRLASRKKWKAAEGGDPASAFALGLAFERGDADHPRDAIEARRWYLRAAEAGHVEAAFRLGELWAWGQGGFKDLAQARQWFSRAAAQGHAAAGARLADLDRSAADADR